MEKQMVSVDEIGDSRCIKRDTVYKWISEKGMPAHKMGRFWKLKKYDVDEWVRDGNSGDFKEDDENWKVLLIEEELHKKMWEVG